MLKMSMRESMQVTMAVCFLGARGNGPGKRRAYVWFARRYPATTSSFKTLPFFGITRNGDAFHSSPARTLHRYRPLGAQARKQARRKYLDIKILSRDAKLERSGGAD
jgi:hypothetical protein